jgi:hypothetical protein
MENEWSLLQNQFDSYEKHSLLIKLANAGVLCAAYLTNRTGIFVFFLLLVLWVQDAIWKTFQSRIEARLLQLEGLMSGASDGKAYRFNSGFLENRPGMSALIGEYFRQALRPTVAYPHAALVLMLVCELLF